MKRKNPPFVHGYVDQHGTTKFYFRRAGQPKVRLPGLPWSPEFMAAHETAQAGEAPKPAIGASRTVPGTVNAALVSYYQSSVFTKGLGESTQQNRRAILERFREEHGDKSIARMHGEALQKILDRKTPAAARNFKKAMRGFIKHCLSLKMIKVDPLAGIELVKMKTKGTIPGRAMSVRSMRNTIRSARALGLPMSCFCRLANHVATSSGWDGSISGKA